MYVHVRAYRSSLPVRRQRPVSSYTGCVCLSKANTGVFTSGYKDATKLAYTHAKEANVSRLIPGHDLL